jgi:anti-sigma-K factor RskA
MSVHEQFVEDLALYALGSLQGEDKNTLEQHLAGCSSCRRELEQLRGDAALLALTATGPRPPVRAKARLMNAIAQEPKTSAATRIPWWSVLGWVTTAALIGLAAILWTQNTRLRSHVVRLTAIAEQERLQHLKDERVTQVLNASDAQRVTVLPVNYKMTPPEGKAIYSRQRGGLIFMASNLNPLPAHKAYELWLVPVQGGPVAAGVFKPDARGSAIVINPPLPVGIEAKAFAVTIEPEQGSSSPTTPIMMIGGT